MVACDPQQILRASNCWQAIPAEQLAIIRTQLLCQILQSVSSMASCDPQTLLNNSQCFACFPVSQLALIQTELLCEILNAGGTGGRGCILCGTTDPVDAPAPVCECALYYNRTNSSFYYWDQVALAWAALIA